MPITKAMCLVGSALCLFCFVGNCSAYDVKPDASQVPRGPTGSLKLVFCALHYKDAAGFAKDREILIRGLKATRPFDKYNHFEFWCTDLSPKEESEVFKSVPDFPPLKVRTDFLAFISAKLKGVYKLVILDA